MIEAPVIIWAASRTASSAEEKVLVRAARASGGDLRSTPMSSLGPEVLSSIVKGPVVVIVDSRKDAGTALRLGADETVRITASEPLLESTLQGALERAAAKFEPRAAAPPTPRGAHPGLALLMRMVERRVGSPLNEAVHKCGELTKELTQVIAVADGLLERVRAGSAREESNGWSREVKQYAAATLRAENLVTELRQQVERGDAVAKLLGSPSTEGSSKETDAESLVRDLARFLEPDLDEHTSLEVSTSGPCLVEVARTEFLCILCAAVENAIDNIRTSGRACRLEVKTSMTDTEVLVEVADDGRPSSTDLRASIVDSVIADPRVTRLRQLREGVRGVGGELAVDADERRTLVSIYLPRHRETAPVDTLATPPRARLERRDH
jgi:signal transduction histidine kinase